MAQVGITTGASDLRAAHAVTVIRVIEDMVFGDRLEKAGPARAGDEFVIRGEQGQTAANTIVGAVLFVIVESATEGRFGALAAGDHVLLLGQLGLPFGICFCDFLNHLGPP
jgi:uncharacterized RmlC-like cupin family protein